MQHFLKDPFEYDFRKLNAKLATTEERAAVQPEPGQAVRALAIADDHPRRPVDQVEPLKKAIRRQDKEQPGIDVIGQIVTIFDLLPGTPEVQRRKLETLAQIRKLTHDPALAVLTEAERADLAKIDPPADLRELAPMDMPPLARRPFSEVDGTVGRVVLVYPPETGVSVWYGKHLLQIAAVLQNIKLDDGKVIETSGFAVVFGAMIRSILKDGPIATIASLIAVLVIILFTMRPAKAALMALGTLVFGVLLMMGGAGWAKVHVTFLNFIALPITFGIGAEYALNVVSRFREERDISRAVVSTGAAVALCSWTTIVGYGSLLAAQNQALQGFGLMAIIGEAACLSAAIIALPAFLSVAAHPAAGRTVCRRRQRGRQAPALPTRRTADHQPVGARAASRSAPQARPATTDRICSWVPALRAGPTTLQMPHRSGGSIAGVGNQVGVAPLSRAGCVEVRPGASQRSTRSRSNQATYGLFSESAQAAAEAASEVGRAREGAEDQSRRPARHIRA